MIAVLASGTGALLAWAPTVAGLPTPPANSVIRELEAWDAPPPLPYVWSPTALDWVIPPPATPPRLSRLQFRWRYTLEEQIAIELAEATHPEATVRATLSILRQSLAEATDVDVADPRTQQGVQYHASLGLIAPERVAVILAPA
jgi:hypothetical protein